MTVSNLITVLIVDDSLVFRKVLRDRLSAYKYIKVVGEAQNGREAVSLTKSLHPYIVILDCEMPVMKGIEALKEIIMNNPDQKVIMFSSKTTFGADITMEALEAGATDFMTKPSEEFTDLNRIISRLAGKIRLIYYKNNLLNDGNKNTEIENCKTGSLMAKYPALIGVKPRRIKLILVGSSTGGVNAALSIVPSFRHNYPPVLWVQHMPDTFTLSFSERLRRFSPVIFTEAQHGDIVKNGCGYVAPGGKHLFITGRNRDNFCLKVTEREEKVSGHKPSYDGLLYSVLEHVRGPEVLCLILTGMGNDGAKGLKLLHDKGAFVIGQNMETCVVYGMPQSAKKNGAVDIEADIKDIPKIMARLMNL